MTQDRIRERRLAYMRKLRTLRQQKDQIDKSLEKLQLLCKHVHRLRSGDFHCLDCGKKFN